MWPEVPFSIATTPRCREGPYSFLCSTYLWSVPLNNAIIKAASTTIWGFVVWSNLGLNPCFPGLVKTLVCWWWFYLQLNYLQALNASYFVLFVVVGVVFCRLGGTLNLKTLSNISTIHKIIPWTPCVFFIFAHFHILDYFHFPPPLYIYIYIYIYIYVCVCVCI